MSAFTRRGGDLCVEAVPLAAIAAEFGTPCYVYSRAELEGGYRAFTTALNILFRAVGFSQGRCWLTRGGI